MNFNIIILLNLIIICIYVYNKQSYKKQIERTNNFVFQFTNLPTKFNYKIFDDIESNLFKRVNLPTRKGEGIGYRTIKANNMNCFIQLYEDKDFLNFISNIVG